jgi:hypothetical protein
VGTSRLATQPPLPFSHDHRLKRALTIPWHGLLDRTDRTASPAHAADVRARRAKHLTGAGTRLRNEGKSVWAQRSGPATR